MTREPDQTELEAMLGEAAADNKRLRAEVERLTALHKAAEAQEWRELQEARAEVERLKAGLQMLAKQEYDAGYTPEDFAKAILSGDEP